MDAVMKTTLARWGNSQGFRLPREICDLLGVKVGSEAKVEVDALKSQVTLTFEQSGRKFRRARKVSIEELFEGYDGEYVAPADWPLDGNEVDWGAPAGNEAW